MVKIELSEKALNTILDLMLSEKLYDKDFVKDFKEAQAEIMRSEWYKQKMKSIKKRWYR